MTGNNGNNKVKLAELATDIKYIRQILNGYENKFVSKNRYRPVELTVYTLAGGVLIWALNQLLGLLGTVKAIF